MGLGPANTSLLHKLGKKQAWEMSTSELEEVVRKDQARRQLRRAMGRVAAILKTSTRPKPAAKTTLESLGLDPMVVVGLRKSGKSDAVIIKAMQAKGLL